MSKHIAKVVSGLARLSTAHLKPKRRAMALALSSELLQQVAEIDTGRGQLRFACPTARALHDPLNFRSDEPETIEWVDRYIQPGDVVWDIGANIGLYALYAALTPRVRVIAFEPSAASFGALVRNIELNGLGDRVSAFCLALTDKNGIDFLHMANTGAGHSMHAFGQLETVEGELRPIFSQAVPGLTIDSACEIFGLPPPDHIKLDVDSIEDKIVEGGRVSLRRVRSVAMEVAGEAGSRAANLLFELGFSALGGGRRNQIFLRHPLTS